jgi:hypothetical protein
MLQKAPEAEKKTDADAGTDDAIYCAQCGHLLTRMRWAVDMDGHERVFINPAGRVFRISCFKEAPGADDEGTPTEEYSWFPGYAWNLAICRGCGVHLGWRFEGTAVPAVFFGLIKSALTQSPPSGDA